MTKKVKKKGRAPPPKEKWVASDALEKVVQPSDASVEDEEGGGSVAKVRKLCPHIDKGVDLNKLKAKIGSSEIVRCEDCWEGTIDRKGGKGKGKHVKKKGGASAELKAVWVCLGCGHYACGGVGLPTTAQCHALRHSRQNHHPLVVKLDNPQLRWCFQCNTIIAIDKSDENGEQRDVFSEVVKLIKGHSSEKSSVDVEDAWFGTGSVTSETKSANNYSGLLDGRGGYMVRGLVNLGNSCFFNSILQNLLAIDRLRSYFLSLESPGGSLTVSLKKLFTETKPESGHRNVINPRAFFGCICSKAPQFRGYQQQDSHELLRCLLDGLCTEELSMRKRMSSSQGSGDSSNPAPTFVDAVFGGQVSSTVRCVECGHSSTVYESFLDLSLPVPTRKSPPKAAQPSSRGKKSKMPPKRSGKVRPKINKEKNTVTSANVATSSTSSELSNQLQSCSTEPARSGISNQPQSSSTELTSTDHSNKLQSSSTELNGAKPSGLVTENISAVQESEPEQVVEDAAEEQVSNVLDDFSWLDYVGQDNVLDDYDLTSEMESVLIVQDSENIDTTLNEVSQQSGSEFSNLDSRLIGEKNTKSGVSSVNAEVEELPLQVQSSEVLLLPYKEDESSELMLLPHQEHSSEVPLLSQKEECPVTEAGMGGEAEATSSAVGCGQDDFDVFGNLFDEHEVYGPSPRPSTDEESAETSFVASESDPDEVDDTNSPVSVESCLAHFIKPELLANENAWHCENCSKYLQRQRLEAKKQAKAATTVLINGSCIQVQSDSLNSKAADIRNSSNGNNKSNSGRSHIGENSVLCDEKVNCSSQTCTSIENAQSDKLNPDVCPQLEGTIEMKDALSTESNTLHCNNSGSLESINSEAIDSCADEPSSVGCASETATQTSSELLDDCKSEASEDEEINSKRVKVKRDATKRYLINKSPPILTVHLKRFGQDARGRLSKLNGHVSFRERIELRPYMDSRCRDTEKYEYCLIGVVEHSGTMRGGHYVAYVRGGERSRGKAENEKIGHVWYYASDAHVREASIDEVLRSEAYILFYEKI